MDLSNITIESKRLRLEPISAKYREEVFREFTEEIAQYMTPEPSERIEDVDDYIISAQKELENGTDVHFVILKKETDEFLGGVGMHKLDTLHPRFGVWIKKSAHGNAYGREAVATVKQWCDTHLDAEYYVYPVDKENIPSRKIAESLGGEVKNEIQKIKSTGVVLDEVEYHIPVST